MNIGSLLLQLLIVSRIVKYTGVSKAVAVQRALAVAAYVTMGFVPVLGLMLAAKISEKSTDYSLNNTVRNMLFLPCTREEKYSAKQVIDSLFVRLADVTSALVVFAGTTIAGLSAFGFARLNILLAVTGLMLAVLVGREYRRLTAPSESRRIRESRSPAAAVGARQERLPIADSRGTVRFRRRRRVLKRAQRSSSHTTATFVSGCSATSPGCCIKQRDVRRCQRREATVKETVAFHRFPSAK